MTSTVKYSSPQATLKAYYTSLPIPIDHLFMNDFHHAYMIFSRDLLGMNSYISKLVFVTYAKANKLLYIDMTSPTNTCNLIDKFFSIIFCITQDLSLL